jgi:hypothetical protein
MASNKSGGSGYKYGFPHRDSLIAYLINILSVISDDSHSAHLCPGTFGIHHADLKKRKIHGLFFIACIVACRIFAG